MGIKFEAWDDDKTKKEILKRFKAAQTARQPFEERWARNERCLYQTSEGLGMIPEIGGSIASNFQSAVPPIDGSDAEVNVAYVFKNFRFIHAQMSANPPSVAMKPTSSDESDRRKADAADKISRWSMRHLDMQEKSDQRNLQTLAYGTGVNKIVWNSMIGDIVDYDEKEEEITLEGDIDYTVPFIWNIFLDPDAKSRKDVKFVFERIYMDYEEACMRWPDKHELLKKAKLEERPNNYSRSAGKQSELEDGHFNCVELLEYWETGLPTNAYMGRYCITTIEGAVIEPCRPSPNRFKRAGAVSSIEMDDTLTDEEKVAKLERLPEQATLPYNILTDIDVPNCVWGRSSVEYAAHLQQNLSMVDSARLDNIQAHGVARLVLPESAEIDDEALSNSAWDVIKITGNQGPWFAQPPQLMPEMTSERQNYITGIDDVMGVNEAMFGQQSREQSGASMQYATNQGNMVRRRLFNKFVGVTESEHKQVLNLVRKHWTVERTINVLGKEKALEAIDVKGMDVDGGYDVVGEYGVTLSLDPITRREEILQLQPMFEKAGVPMRTSLKLMKLNELEGMYDKLDMAGNRQKEIFDEMIATGRYIEPKKYRDHANMIAWAMDYFMTQEFTQLPDELQQLCETHIEQRGQLAAMESPQAAEANTPPGPIPGGAPAGPVPPPTGAPAPTGPM